MKMTIILSIIIICTIQQVLLGEELFYKDGTIYYRGDVENNIPHGLGTMHEENGSIKHDGLFLCGKPVIGNTYIMDSGSTFSLKNKLPDTINSYFSFKSLIETFKEKIDTYFDQTENDFEQLDTDISIRVFLKDKTLYLGVYIYNFDPHNSRLNIDFVQNDLIELFIPQNLMTYVSYWFSDIVLYEMPTDISNSLLNNYVTSYFCFFSKNTNEYLIIFGDIRRSQLGNYMAISSPLVVKYQNYKETKIYPENYQELDSPLGPYFRLGDYRDIVSGEYLTPYLVYQFFEKEIEKKE